MTLAKLSSHAAAHNWFAAGVDVVVLMIGIFLGTEAGNWNQARLDRDRGREYRLRLIEEIHAGEQQLESRRLYFQAVRNHARQALASLDRPSTDVGAAFVTDAYQASQIIPTLPARATYDEVVSTGNVEHLGSARTREQIANYYIIQASTAEILNFVPPYREHVRETIPGAAQEAIREQCPERWRLGRTGLYTLELPRNCVVSIDQAEVQKAVYALRASPRFKPDLTRLITDLDSKMTVVDALLLQAGTVKAGIAQRH